MGLLAANQLRNQQSSCRQPLPSWRSAAAQHHPQRPDATARLPQHSHSYLTVVPQHHPSTAWLPPGYRPAAVSYRPAAAQLATRPAAPATAQFLSRHRRTCPTTAWLPPGYRPATARLPPKYRPATAQVPPGYRPQLFHRSLLTWERPTPSTCPRPQSSANSCMCRPLSSCSRRRPQLPPATLNLPPGCPPAAPRFRPAAPSSSPVAAQTPPPTAQLPEVSAKLQI